MKVVRYAVIGTLVVLCPLSAAAQQLPAGETVNSRPRPETDPLGVRVGSFLLFPRLAMDAYYDDNIFNAPSSRRGDFVTVVNPKVSLESDWTNHSLILEGSGGIGFYADNTDENYQDYGVKADGRFDVTRDIAAYAGIAYNEGHEDRGSPDDVGGADPTIFNSAPAYLRYDHIFGRMNVTADLNALILDYSDATASTGPINNDDRDRLETGAQIRVGYEIIPTEYAVFGRVRVNDRSYDDGIDDNGLDRDSHGAEGVIGVELNRGGIVFGDLFVGFAGQRYGDANLPNIAGVTGGGSMNWNITPLMTLNGTVARSIEETTLNNASGFFSTRLSTGLDYELLRNLLLNAQARVSQSDYEGTNGFERTDYVYGGGLGARYLLNRYFYASFDYTHERRASSDSRGGVDPDYENNVFLIRLEGQL